FRREFGRGVATRLPSALSRRRRCRVGPPVKSRRALSCRAEGPSDCRIQWRAGRASPSTQSRIELHFGWPPIAAEAGWLPSQAWLSFWPQALPALLYSESVTRIVAPRLSSERGVALGIP